MRRWVLAIAGMLMLGALSCAILRACSLGNPFEVSIPFLHGSAFFDGNVQLDGMIHKTFFVIRLNLRELAVYGVLFGSLMLLILLPGHIRNRRASGRRSQGLCPKCAYNLTGNTSGICPECGTTITPQPPGHTI